MYSLCPSEQSCLHVQRPRNTAASIRGLDEPNLSFFQLGEQSCVHARTFGKKLPQLRALFPRKLCSLPKTLGEQLFETNFPEQSLFGTNLCPCSIHLEDGNNLCPWYNHSEQSCVPVESFIICLITLQLNSRDKRGQGLGQGLQ